MLLLIATAPEGRLFGLDQQTLISIGIHLLNACVLAVALSFILYKPVTKFLRNRADGIKKQLSDAEDAMNKANELKALYEQKLEGIKSERVKIFESANALAEEKSKQILQDAQKESAAMKKQAAADILIERERASEEMRTQIIEIATAVAEKFIENAIDADTQNRLFEETMAQLEGAAWNG